MATSMGRAGMALAARGPDKYGRPPGHPDWGADAPMPAPPVATPAYMQPQRTGVDRFGRASDDPMYGADYGAERVLQLRPEMLSLLEMLVAMGVMPGLAPAPRPAPVLQGPPSAIQIPDMRGMVGFG